MQVIIMKMIRNFGLMCMATGLMALAGCRVETHTETVPEAEGSGKKAINIRLEPMSRDEIKDVADRAIDKTAEAATTARAAATTAVQNAERIGQIVTTLSDTMININREPAADEAVTTPAN